MVFKKIAVLSAVSLLLLTCFVAIDYGDLQASDDVGPWDSKGTTVNYDSTTQIITVSATGTGADYGRMDDYTSNNPPGWIRANIPISEVIFESGVKYIGVQSFYAMNHEMLQGSLTKVTISETVTEIGNSAFSWCSSLSKINEDNVFPSGLKKIGQVSFLSTGLTEITIPSNVTEVGRATFCMCSDLTKVKWDANVSQIKDDFVEKVDSALPSEIFEDCSSLKEVAFGPNAVVKEVCEMAFYGTLSLITLGDAIESITKLNTSAFHGSGITEIAFSNLTEIPEDAFGSCRSLETVDAPAVTTVGEKAFYACQSLDTVSIPSISNVGNLAFASSGLREINLFTSGNWKVIGKGVFSDCQNLQAFNFLNVVEIGESAFQNCRSLKGVILPDTVKSIGDSAFKDCASVSVIEIPQSVTKIGDEAFGMIKFYDKSGNQIDATAENLAGHTYTVFNGTMRDVTDSPTKIDNIMALSIGIAIALCALAGVALYHYGRD